MPLILAGDWALLMPVVHMHMHQFYLGRSLSMHPAWVEVAYENETFRKSSSCQDQFDFVL